MLRWAGLGGAARPGGVEGPGQGPGAVPRRRPAAGACTGCRLHAELGECAARVQVWAQGHG